MKWNDHNKLEGLHAFMGASQWHWINWDDETFIKSFDNQYAQNIGTTIHALASDCIKNRIKVDENDRHLIDITLYKAGIPKSAYDPDAILTNLIPFVNDAIGYHMSSEVILYYSPFCFGTTDAIGYDDKLKILRIHDYKSGKIPAHIEQLMIYAALFCLEYVVDPKKLKGIELRIYQNNQVLEYFPKGSEVEGFMNMIKIRSEFAENLFKRDGR